MQKFIEKMTKVELHAHLNGCLTTKTLKELAVLKYREHSTASKMLWLKVDTTECSLSDCFQKFKIAHELTATKECLRKATLSVIKDFEDDNVCYLELRTTPKTSEQMTKLDYLETVVDAVTQARTLHASIVVKLLPSIDRTQGVDSARTTLAAVAACSEKHPDIIVGIDFSGNPEIGNFQEYIEVFNEARNLNLKLAFHCGETENNAEIRQMLEFGMDRCGHGTFISESNLDILRKKKIPVECCLSSNLKCRTVHSYDSHHFLHLYNSAHPVVICTDDPAIFDTTLSKELLLAADSYELSKDDLMYLTLNSVSYSFAPDDVKHSLKQKILESFEDYNYLLRCLVCSSKYYRRIILKSFAILKSLQLQI